MSIVMMDVNARVPVFDAIRREGLRHGRRYVAAARDRNL